MSAPSGTVGSRGWCPRCDDKQSVDEVTGVCSGCRSELRCCMCDRRDGSKLSYIGEDLFQCTDECLYARCSFCAKSMDAKKLMAGSDARICDGCIKSLSPYVPAEETARDEARPPALPPSEPTPRCSFCGKLAGKLVAGPDAWICEECVRICNGAMSPAEFRCSFCGKPHAEMKELCTGPAVCICDKCLRLCNRVLVEGAGSACQVLTLRVEEKAPSVAELLGLSKAGLAALVKLSGRSRP